MSDKCFDIDNCIAVCDICHSELHKELGSHMYGVDPEVNTAKSLETMNNMIGIGVEEENYFRNKINQRKAKRAENKAKWLEMSTLELDG